MYILETRQSLAWGGVVSKDVPPHSIVVGNPAKVIREGINVENYHIVE